jgi:predicted GNAT family acetyltransferase
MKLTYTLSKNQTTTGKTFYIWNENNFRVGIFEFHKLPEYPDIIEIDKLYIKTKYQKQGIGTYVVNSIFEKYKPNIIIACCLSVQFWLKIGFQFTPEKWGVGYYECLRKNFLKKKKEKQDALQKKKSRMVKPTAERLLKMDYFVNMDFEQLVDVIGNQLSFNQFNKLHGLTAREKAENIKNKTNFKKNENKKR